LLGRILKKVQSLSSSTTRSGTPTKVQAIQELRQEFDVALLLAYGKVARSTIIIILKVSKMTSVYHLKC